MSKKVIITGASGLLGRAVYKEFVREGSWEVLGLAWSRTGEKLSRVDLRDQKAVQKVVQEFQVSCAG